MAGKVVDHDGLAHFKSKMTALIDEELKSFPAVVSSGEGFRAFSDGRVEQWGFALIANGNGTRIVFHAAFASKVESVQCTASGSIPVSFSVATDGLVAATVKHNGNGGVYVFWRAIGK